MKLSRWAVTAAALAAVMTVSAPLAAHAEDPVDLSGSYIVDTVRAITPEEGDEILLALDDLYTRADIQLFVVYVGTFTNPSNPIDWADAVAIDNGLGADDVLLAVALDDRQYALSVDPDFSLGDAQLDTVERAIESELRGDNWAQAAIAGAQTLQAEATGVVGPNQPTDPTAPTTGSEGGIPILPIVGGVAVVGVGVFIYSRIRRRGAGGATTSVPEQMTQKQLDTRAGSLLVQLDDSLKTSEQELGFAIAQFGDAATKDFSLVLASAKKKVAEAFAIKQQLDDVNPDSAEEKRAWTTQIIQLCEAADAELDDQADAFDELRQLEKDAPAALARVVEATSAARTRSATAAATLDELTERYAASATKPVAENVAQAEKLLDFADAAAKKAEQSIAASQASEAAIAVRTAQSSVGQAEQLFGAIDSLATSLDEAAHKLEAAVADTTQDIAAAKALPADPSATQLAPAIAAAVAVVDEMTGAKTDPIAALAKIEKANSALDQVFVGVRDEQQKKAAARAKLDGSLTAARAQLTSAMEYITTRRGGIGESARTRISESERLIAHAEAIASSDPVTALAESQRAYELASTAFDLARRDVESFAAQENYRSMPRGSDGADLGGLLGGLVGGMLGSGGGGGRSGGYRPSSGSRSGTRSGSFGGSSRSSGGSRGSRSSGGRSRGGRF